MSSRYESNTLQPRTPHSRAGAQRFLDNDDEIDEVDMLQSHPLLASSTSATFSRDVHERSIHLPTYHTNSEQGDHKRPGVLKRLAQRTPYALGIIVALFLLLLIVVSYKKPEVLEKVIGESEEKKMADSMVIKYNNYTSFPLQSDQYLMECWKVNQKTHAHLSYWAVPQHGFPDVAHKTEPGAGGVCSGTMTYILDGNFGLFKELALISQLAGLAREVIVYSFSYGELCQLTKTYLA